MRFTKNGEQEIKIKTTDDCGNETRGVRSVVIVQNLVGGQYINITDGGDTATISADISADYYNKAEVNELIADLDTVQFKVVATLPPVGGLNIIYLVEKTAPDTGYDQYIWNDVDREFEPIGDTNIDLSDYYTKAQSDNRYYQRTDVYNKTESDARYYQKAEVYNKTESDTKFQEKLTATTGITSVDDNTELSNVDLTGKTVKNMRMSHLWTYIKGKFTGTSAATVLDSTRISSLDATASNIHTYFSVRELT